jgi:hypothetical protein
MKKIYFLIITVLLFISSQAQDQKGRSAASKDYSADAVIHKQYGVNFYQPLNMMLGGDTVRNDANGYAANGYIQDFYTTGQLLHKGFYVDGLLKVYKNYFPNGQVERNFRMVDLKKSKMTIYYKEGSIKSNIVYVHSEALIWEDFYPNGLLEFVEEYDKDFQYYMHKANYYEDGSPENELVLLNKKKLLYTQIYYYSNGKIKEQGEMRYNKAEFDYEKIGTWMFYNESGKATKSQKYASGQVVNEKNL